MNNINEGEIIQFLKEETFEKVITSSLERKIMGNKSKIALKSAYFFEFIWKQSNYYST